MRHRTLAKGALLVLLLFAPAWGQKLEPSDRQDLKKRLDDAMARVAVSGEPAREGLKYNLVKGDMINAFVPHEHQEVILVYEGALTGLPEPQLHFLLAHEYVHANRRHSAQQGGGGILAGLARVGINILTRNSSEEQRKDFDQFGKNLQTIAHRQYGQKQEQEADREALKMMAKMGYDPVNAILYFQSQSPQDEEKDMLGTHPTFAARIDDLARFLPLVDFEPPELTSSKSLFVKKPEYLPEGTFAQGVFDPTLSSELHGFLEAGESGLFHDPVGSQTLQSQVQGSLKSESTPGYNLVVKQYRARVSSTVMESDVISEIAKALKSGAGFRAYAIAASRDHVGNRQVAILLIR